MKKKPVPFEKLHATLKDIAKQVDEAYELCFTKSLEGGPKVILAIIDREKYSHTSTALWELVYQLEQWTHE